MSLLHDKYVIVSADKVPNNIVVVCKSHYIDCLIQELGISLHLESPHILRRHLRKRNSWTVIRLFYVPLEFQPKKNFPFKQWYIACSAKCCTKPLSKLLTCIISAVKTGLHSYCDTSYSRGGVNRKWILKKGHILLCKKENTLILPKSSLKLISSTCSSF